MDNTLRHRQAEICKMLASPTRLELLHLLRDGERTVHELQQAACVPQTTVSQHLARLRTIGMVRARKQGHHVFYTLVDGRILDACDTIADVLASHLADEGALAERLNGGAD